MNNIEEVIKFSKTLNLLYVEDNKALRESTILILEIFFKTISIAEDGEDGFNKFKQLNNNKDIDLIITDINMPKLNGLEMTAKIREIDQKIPILVLSAYNESGYFIESIKLGVEGYLLKPIDIDQFVNVLSKITLKIKLSDIAKRSENLLAQYKDITDKSSIVSIITPNKIITYVNDSFCKLSGYSKDELIGVEYHSILKYKQPKEIHNDIWETIEIKKEIWMGVIRFVGKDDEVYYLRTTIKPILDQNNNIIEFISIRYDVTEIMNSQKQLVDAIKNKNEPLLVYMKLEDYDILEEFYNTKMMKSILNKIRKYLEDNLPLDFNFGKVYELGNGEYAITCEKLFYIQNKSNFIEQLKLYQERVKNGIIDIEDINYDISILVSLSYEANLILENAKIGIKKLLKNKQDFIISNNFANVEFQRAEENIKIITMIKKAINNSKIILYFQAIIDNKTKRIVKHEALVRLIDEDKQIIAPFFFLEIAKKGKYYSQITNIVLEKSFEALKTINGNISINLSALDIEDTNTRNKLLFLLKENQQDASRIILELLEDEEVKDFEIIKKFITEVKQLNVRIAIDDFGSGYSNFQRLLDYQPDIIKIDSCLIRNIATDLYSRSVVETIVSFAKKQNIKTTAEYVENKQIFDIVCSLNIDYSQGYYIGKPTPLNQVTSE